MENLSVDILRERVLRIRANQKSRKEAQKSELEIELELLAANNSQICSKCRTGHATCNAVRANCLRRRLITNEGSTNKNIPRPKKQRLISDMFEF